MPPEIAQPIPPAPSAQISPPDEKSRQDKTTPASDFLPRIQPKPLPKPTQIPKAAPREPGSSNEPSNIPEPTPVLQPRNRASASELPPPDGDQLAPPVPTTTGRAKSPHLQSPRSSAADREAEELAAEVAAILAEDAGETRREPADSRAPRPLIVKLPSEKYLTEATRQLQTLPMDERPAAFQSMIEKYRTMRAAERESMRKR